MSLQVCNCEFDRIGMRRFSIYLPGYSLEALSTGVQPHAALFEIARFVLKRLLTLYCFYFFKERTVKGQTLEVRNQN
jgi:hypothetical protein